METASGTNSGDADGYRARLLRRVGAAEDLGTAPHDLHPDLAWARSGAMALTGQDGGPPLPAPAPLATCAQAALDALRGLAGPGARLDLDAAALLGERAAISNLTRRGTTSPGGSARLLRAADGWIAVNLARPDDAALLPAWLGETGADGLWAAAARGVRRRPAVETVERARCLGLPAALAVAPAAEPPAWLGVAAAGPRRPRPASDLARPRVLDLSSLWAGPLCTHLLGLAGARVIKVECVRRPDGARTGPARFFDLLNAGKESVALDFTDAADRRVLYRLAAGADIVVESARPRALAQLGVDAADLVRRRPGLTWVSITGYGRRPPADGWVAFGDDAAVAAGLAVATGPPGGPPLFCGDAIADPLTGLHAAVAALACFRAGGGALLDLALRNVVGHVLATRAPPVARVLPRPAGGASDAEPWEVVVDGTREPVRRPRARAPGGRARPLGTDTTAVLRELAAC